MSIPVYALTDDALLAGCRRSSFSGGGPGGQHRNRHAVGVKLVHNDTECEALCIDHRDREANLRTALRRLRLRLATVVRGVGERALIEPFIVQRKFAIGPAATNYPLVVGVALDALEDQAGQLSDAAATLGVSTSQLARLLVANKSVRHAADVLRQRFELGPLKA